MEIPAHLNHKSLQDAEAAAKTKGLCGARYRRTIYEAPWSRVCLKEPHTGNRHSDKVVKENPDAEPAGTCQVCFRKQQTRAGLLVLHGYKRPGHGYIIGNCYAHGYAPFEVSCERTKQYLEKVLRATLTRWEANLARLQARPDDLSYNGQVYVGYGAASANHSKSPYASVPVRVVRGAPETVVETNIPDTGRMGHGGADFRFRHIYGRDPKAGVCLLQVPAYNYLLEREISEQEGKIRMVKQDIASYEKKVADWKPAIWPKVA